MAAVALANKNVRTAAVQGETPMSRLLARCVVSGLAANSSTIAVVPALLRAPDLAVLATAFTEEVAFRPLAVRAAQPPCSTKNALRRRHDAARRSRHWRQLLAASPSGLIQTGRLHRV